MQQKVVEFFSGIGGWSCALSRIPLSLGQFKVVAAFDINTLANDVYFYNHKLRPSGKSLERVNSMILENFQADIWVMSPPCQPFTRSNTTEDRDAGDARSKAFLYLIEQLQSMKRKPSFIALENVVGFESSVCCESFLKILREVGYHYQQFHLDPLHFGIPNSRPRYYCTAWLKSSLPPQTLSTLTSTTIEDTLATVHKRLPHQLECIPMQSLAHYLDTVLDHTQLEEYAVSESLLDTSAAWCLDIQTAASTYTACFTKSYGRYIKGTGSVILSITLPATSTSTMTTEEHTKQLVDTESAIFQFIQSNNIGQKRKFEEDWWKVLQAEFPSVTIRLRYFTPKELLRLFGFPDWFVFAIAAPLPSSQHNKKKEKRQQRISKEEIQSTEEIQKVLIADGGPDRQDEAVVAAAGVVMEEESGKVATRKQYELIGNSINVTVVMHLLEYLFLFPTQITEPSQ